MFTVEDWRASLDRVRRGHGAPVEAVELEPDGVERDAELDDLEAEVRAMCLIAVALFGLALLGVLAGFSYWAGHGGGRRRK